MPIRMMFSPYWHILATKSKTKMNMDALIYGLKSGQWIFFPEIALGDGIKMLFNGVQNNVLRLFFIPRLTRASECLEISLLEQLNLL